MSLLFVYGTLQSTYLGDQSIRLRSEAKFFGKAFTRGQLYKIDWYPGLKPGEGEVYGELYELLDESNTLEWLDEYEDFDFSKPETSLYSRQKVNVTEIATLKNYEAWAYIYTGFTDEKDRIVDGHFKPSL